jgi:hypothetical protein
LSGRRHSKKSLPRSPWQTHPENQLNLKMNVDKSMQISPTAMI